MRASNLIYCPFPSFSNSSRDRTFSVLFDKLVPLVDCVLIVSEARRLRDILARIRPQNEELFLRRTQWSHRLLHDKHLDLPGVLAVVFRNSLCCRLGRYTDLQSRQSWPPPLFR